MPASDGRRRLLRLARRNHSLTARQVVGEGIHRQVLTRMVGEGTLERVGRGLYRLASRPISEHHGLAMAATVAPDGVICLLSALGFHGLGTQLPHEVWIAIDQRARRPRLGNPRLRIVRSTGGAFTEGIEVHRIEGQPVRVYGVAKTIADCFKYRNKIGLDVALEALREGWRARRFTMDELDRYAKICRVERVMRPYVEALVT